MQERFICTTACTTPCLFLMVNPLIVFFAAVVWARHAMLPGRERCVTSPNNETNPLKIHKYFIWLPACKSRRNILQLCINTCGLRYLSCTLFPGESTTTTQKKMFNILFVIYHKDRITGMNGDKSFSTCVACGTHSYGFELIKCKTKGTSDSRQYSRAGSL